ncbi:MAG: hypothetical protein ACI4HL_05810 [Ruminococcus sp.]
MSKGYNNQEIALILFECMKSNSTVKVADRFGVPYALVYKWEREHSTIWVLRTLGKLGKEKI